jgi:outer membrane protein assembly factor BamB
VKIVTFTFYSNDKKINCLDSENGNLLWEHKTNGIVNSSPIISEGKLYFETELFGLKEGTGNSISYGMLHCLNAENGEIIWEYKTSDVIGSSPLIFNDKIYFGIHNANGEGGLFCLNAIKGEKVWVKSIERGVYSSPIILNGKLYFVSDKPNTLFYCLDALKGETIWTSYINIGKHTPLVISNERIFFSSAPAAMNCLNALNGKMIWEYKATGSGSIVCSPVVSNKKVLFGSLSAYAGTTGMFYCLDEESGKEVWKYKTNVGIRTSPVICKGRVYFGLWDSRSHYFDIGNPKIYSLDIYSGEKIWEFKTNHWISSSPLVSNGKIYFGSNDGSLYCFGDEE